MRILFDCDGTLADTSEGVLESACYALKKMRVEIPPYERLKGFIGPALHSGFSVIAGLNAEDADKAVVYYREFYKKEGIYKAKLYEGMEQLLKSLALGGHELAVASLKPQEQLNTVIRHLGIYDCFTAVVGPSDKKKDSDKREILLAAAEGKNAVMIGDSPFDIMAGNALGYKTIAVTYGFSSEEKLKEQSPTFIARDTNEILKIINNLTE